MIENLQSKYYVTKQKDSKTGDILWLFQLKNPFHYIPASWLEILLDLGFHF